MFAIKYMQHWNGATLAHSIVEVRTTNTLLFGFFGSFPKPAHDFGVCCTGQDASISIEVGRELADQRGKQC